MFSSSKSFFRKSGGGSIVTPSDASFSSVPLLLETTSTVTGKSTTVSDVATPSYATTVSGSPTFGLTSPYQPDGYWSNQFNGSNAYLSSTIPALSGQFTVDFWVYRPASGINYFFTIGDALNSTGFEVYIGSSGTAFNFYSSGATQITSATLPAVGAWSYVAVTRDASNVIRLYLNGTQVGSTYTSSATFATTLRLGVEFYNSTLGYGNNYISNFRISNTVRTVSSNPTSPFSNDANTLFLSCQSNRFKDNSTNNYVISASGTPVVSAETPIQADGYWSNYFNGSTDWLSVSPNTSGVLNFGTNPYTVEFWFYGLVKTANQMILRAQNANGSLQIYIDTSGIINFGPQNSAVTIQIPSANWNINTWNHIAFSRVGTGSNQLTVYVNGVSIASATDSFNYTITGIDIGAGTNFAGGYYLNGYISNARLVKGVAIYTAAFTPPTTPLTAITNTALLTCQSSSFKDNSTNNFTITRNGSPVTKSVTQPFISSITSNGSALFNGSTDWLNSTAASTVLQFGTGAYTVEGWVYQTSRSGTQFICGGQFSGNGFQVSIDASGYIAFSVPGFAAATAATIAIPLNTWTHFALVRTSTSAGGFTYYINGVAAGTITDANNYSGTTTTLNIATTNNSLGGSTPLTGYLSNLRIVKGVAVYTGTFTPPTNFLTTTGGTYPSTSNVTTSIASSSTSMLVDLTNGKYAGSSTLNTVTRTGSPTTGWTSPYQTDGYWSNYFGTSTSDNIYAASNVAFTVGTSNFTVEFWANWTTWSGEQRMILMGQSGSSAIEIGRGAGANALLVYTNTSQKISYSWTPTIGTWYHVAVVRSGTGTNQLTLYINGINVATGTSADNITTNNFFIGGLNWATGYNTQGYISNVRFVNGTAVYTGNFTPPTTPLTVTQSSGTNISAITGTATSLLTCQSNRFIDNSSTPKTITVNGTPSVQSGYYPSGFTAPTASPGAGYFNGNGDYLTIPNNPALRLGTLNFTLECWVYWSGTNSGNASLFNLLGSTWSGYSQTGQWIFYVTPSTGISTFQVWNSVGVSAATALVQNRWYHIAVTRSGNIFKLYLNGKLDATNTISLDASTTVWDFYIGRFYDPSGPTYSGYFPGYLSDLRLVLNTVVYTGDFTPPTGKLTQTGGTYPSLTNVVTGFSAANTSLLLNFADSNYTSASTGVNNNTFVDNSNYAYTIGRNGTPTQGSFTPYWPNGQWSNYFDGDGDYLTWTGTALGSGNFTIEFWSYPLELRSNGPYFDSSSGLMVRQDTANILVYDRTNAAAFSTTGNLCKLNAWNHIAVVRNSGTITVYINGVSGGSSANTTNFTATSYFMGAFINSSTSPNAYYGYLSNYRIVGGTAVYTANFTPSTIPLTATQSANVNGNPSAAITGTATSLLTCQSNRFIDNSVNSALVTASGTPSVQAFAPFSTGVAYSPVLHGGSGYFKGSPDYLYTPINTAFTFGTNNFTVEYWLNLSSTSGGRVSCTLGNATTFDPLMGYFAAGESTFRVYLSSNNSSWDISNGTTLSYAMNLNSWYHVAIVRNGSNIALYVNGSSVGSITSSASIYQSANDIILGLGQSSFYFPGYISNFRFTRAAVYNASFTLPTAPVSNVTGTNLLLNFTNAAIYDASAQNDITTVGDTQSSTTIFKWAPTSMKFDGTGDYLNVSTGSPQSLTFGTGDFTIEFWVYFTSNTGFQTLYDGRAAAGIYPLLYLNNGVINYYVGSSAVITSVQPSTGVWIFMSLRRSSGTTQFFINGTQSGGSYADSNNYLAPPTSGARVGANYTADSFLFGYIQDLRISKTARSVTTPTASFPTR